MKRTGFLFEQIIDINNLVLAHLNARANKTDYKEVREVDRDVLGHCQKIREMLINKTFTTSEYHTFKIVDRGKERDICELPYFPDRIIQWALLQVVEKVFLKHFIADTYAALPGKKKIQQEAQTIYQHQRNARGARAAQRVYGGQGGNALLLEAGR